METDQVGELEAVVVARVRVKVGEFDDDLAQGIVTRAIVIVNTMEDYIPVSKQRYSIL